MTVAKKNKKKETVLLPLSDSLGDTGFIRTTLHPQGGLCVCTTV